MTGSFVIPVLCNRFCPRVKLNTILTQNMQITKEEVFITGKWEVSGRNGNTNIYTHHTTVCQEFELSGVESALSEDDRTVGKGVGIHNGQPFIKVTNTLN